jgi:hypothetical protein
MESLFGISIAVFIISTMVSAAYTYIIKQALKSGGYCIKWLYWEPSDISNLNKMAKAN